MTSELNLTGEVYIVTGANAGIGFAASKQLSQAGATVVMACRNPERGAAALKHVIAESGSSQVELGIVDLSSLASIRTFVSNFEAKHGQLHGLINNAANFDITTKQPSFTSEGAEMIFATNHLGPFLLTNMLLERMKASAPARVVNIYSKLAQVMFTLEWSKRLEGSGVSANAIRVPNVRIDTDRYPNLSPMMLKMYAFKQRFATTPEQMAEGYLRIAASPEFEGVTGKYFDENGKAVKLPKFSLNNDACTRLWKVSAETVGI